MIYVANILIILLGSCFCGFFAADVSNQQTTHYEGPNSKSAVKNGSIESMSFVTCPSPITQGILRNTTAGPFKYYPIGDKVAIGRMVENLGFTSNERNIQRLLHGGCPMISSFAIDDGISSNNTGLGQWVKRICLFTDPVFYLKSCNFPEIDTKNSFDMSITLQLDEISGGKVNSYRVSTRCFQDVAYSWIVVASTPRIPLNFLQQIRRHVVNLGFNWEDARTIHYDHCISCS